MTRLRMRRRRSRGQSLVEMSLVAPALVALAAGCGQVGVIAYGAASVETSARAAARVAAEYPNRSLDFVATLGVSTYTCGQTPSDTETENSVCTAARGSAGLLSGSSLTVTITSSSTISRAVPDDVVQLGNTCPGGALETGTVSNLPSGTVATISSPSKASVGTVLSDSSGNYSICLSAPSTSQGNQSSSITATAVDASGCTYNTSVGITVTPAKTVTPSPADMSLPTTGVCPTPQPAATATPTPSPTPTPSSLAWQSGSLPTPQAETTCSTSVSDTSWVQVTVSYAAPVFVPIVGHYFETTPGSGTRVVKATQRMQVEPCAVTQGG